MCVSSGSFRALDRDDVGLRVPDDLEQDEVSSLAKRVGDPAQRAADPPRRLRPALPRLRAAAGEVVVKLAQQVARRPVEARRSGEGAGLLGLLVERGLARPRLEHPADGQPYDAAVEGYLGGAGVAVPVRVRELAGICAGGGDFARRHNVRRPFPSDR